MQLDKIKLKADLLEAAREQFKSLTRVSRIGDDLVSLMQAQADEAFSEQYDALLTKLVKTAVAQHRRGSKTLGAPTVAPIAPAARRRA